MSPQAFLERITAVEDEEDAAALLAQIQDEGFAGLLKLAKVQALEDPALEAAVFDAIEPQMHRTMYVDEWPADERDFYRELWDTLDREQQLLQLRTRKSAKAALEAVAASRILLTREESARILEHWYKSYVDSLDSAAPEADLVIAAKLGGHS